MSWSLKIQAAPIEEPVHLAEAKDQCRVEHTVDDSVIGAAIIAARQMAEVELGRALVTRTYDLLLDAFPACGAPIILPMPPVASVTHIKYYDVADMQQTWATSDWEADLSGLVPRIRPKLDKSFPATRDRLAAVEIRYIAGFGAPKDVPMAIKQWMLLAIGSMYAQRESIAAKELFIAPFVGGLLDPYRQTRVL